IHIDIREQWTNDPTLRCTAQGGSIAPLFEVSGLEQAFNQGDETAIMDLRSEYRCKDLVIDVIKTSFDVSFDEPFRTRPCEMYITKGGVTSAFRSESVGVRAKLRIVVGVQ